MRAAALFLFACGSEPSHPIVPDATFDSAPEVGPNTVTVELVDDYPSFIAYRDGTAPWQDAVAHNGSFELEVHDGFEVVAVCGNDDIGFDTGYQAINFDETQGELYLPCVTPFNEMTPTVSFTGTMVQAGSVLSGYEQRDSATANWQFQLPVLAGVHDLAAVGGNRMVVRRNLSTAAPALPTIDLASAGTAMPTVTLTAAGTQSDDALSIQTSLITTNEFLALPAEAGSTVHVVPAALLTSVDAQTLWLRARAGQSTRSAVFTYTGTVPSFTLLPRLATVQFGVANSVSWTSLPEGELSLFTQGGKVSVEMSASPGWRAGRTELAFPTDIPSFRPEWLPSPIEYKSVTVRQRVNKVSLSSRLTGG